jgi:hypothetical protein
VAELVDAPDSKSGGGNIVLVRVRPGAPLRRSPSFAFVRRRPNNPVIIGISLIIVFAAVRGDLLVSARFVGIFVGIL